MAQVDNIDAQSTCRNLTPFQDETFIRNNEIMAGLALGELEMWTHRFIGMPSQIKEFEDIGTWCNKSNARVYFMNLIFYNYFSGLVYKHYFNLSSKKN